VRILVVSQYFWPEDFRINELVSELIVRGHDLTILTGRPNYPAGTLFPAFRDHPERFARYRGARVIRVPMLSRGRGGIRLALNYASFAVSATLVGILRLWRSRFDAVFVFEPSPVTVGLPAIALRALKGWPVAFWILDQWPETLAAVGAVRSPTLLRWAGRLVSFIYRRCDVLLAPSRSLMGQARRYTRPGQRVEYFPNWAETGYGDAEAAPAPEVPSWSGRFSIMFAGNIGESQNFGAILDAAESLREDAGIRWLIVGDGRAAAWVQNEIERRQLQERVLMLGRRPQERMPSFFRHADALLVSLKADPVFAMTVPGKIQSYLAFGRPVLGMLDGEAAQVISEAGAGFTCAAGDAAGLARIASELSRSTAQARAAMGASGAAYARREFDRDVLLTRLESLLGEISSTAVGAGAA
jgi:colanic acid biosynthesis glycosyl transferase WcaI